MNLQVTQTTIKDLLSLLSKGEWQIPKFQREFIWTRLQVYELLHSIFKARPIGLVTVWRQPQGEPQTDAEPVKLKRAQFGHWDAEPAVVKYVLDGRQRLTALAMAFGGLRDPDDRYQYSGAWYLNLDKSPDEDEFIAYKKKRDIARLGLDQMGKCLAAALIPLHDYAQFAKYNQNIHNGDFYPGRILPGEEVRNKRSERLELLLTTFLTFQIPVAELPEAVTLAEVCEIFDVLNTTGTRVSTFDLIHNLIYADTAGGFRLRERFANYREELQAFGLYCDADRPELLCQSVTACYLTEPSPVSRKQDGKKKDEKEEGKKDGEKGKLLHSIKGGDLVETPTPFYKEFDANVAKLDTYCTDLFDACLGGQFKSSEIAYPVSASLYFAIRWHGERLEVAGERYSTADASRLFRAFYWRNALTGRYDQGFLTLFGTDLKQLIAVLKEGVALSGEAWTKTMNTKLDDLFGNQHARATEEKIGELLADGELRGAVRQAIGMVFLGRVKRDLVTGSALDRTATKKTERVELHHLFPVDWCKNNRASHQVLVDDEDKPDCFANLIPLSGASNNKWKTLSPATAVADLAITWSERHEILESAGIGEAAFAVLSERVNVDPAKFWALRGAALAREIATLQVVT